MSRPDFNLDDAIMDLFTAPMEKPCDVMRFVKRNFTGGRERHLYLWGKFMTELEGSG